MNMGPKIGTALILLFLIIPALAEEQTLVLATSDKDKRVEKLCLKLDDTGEPTHLVQHMAKGGERSFTASQLAGGVVLRKESGRDVIKLSSLRFDPKRGGLFQIRYLYNGIPPEQYETVTLRLKREGEKWGLYFGKNKDPIKGLHFVSNFKSVFGLKKRIGILSVNLKR